MNIAFLFPGQGSQKTGMGKSFFDNDAASREVYKLASDLVNLDMEELIFTPDDRLDITEYTQVAMVTTGIAMLKAIEKLGISPSVCAGLSLGEYEALYACGVISETDAIRISRYRGRLMQEAIPPGVGAMAAVLNLDAASIEDTIRDIDGVWIANYNCPGQIVISGLADAVARAAEELKARGAKRVLPLNVSGPFHSKLLEPAGEKLYEYLADVSIAKPSIPYIANYNAKPVYDADEVKGLLKKQVSAAVKFEQSIRTMLEMGVDCFVEIGPGKTLSGFVKKIDSSVHIYNIENYEDLEKLKEM